MVRLGGSMTIPGLYDIAWDSDKWTTPQSNITPAMNTSPISGDYKQTYSRKAGEMITGLTVTESPASQQWWSKQHKAEQREKKIGQLGAVVRPSATQSNCEREPNVRDPGGKLKRWNLHVTARPLAFLWQHCFRVPDFWHLPRRRCIALHCNVLWSCGKWRVGKHHFDHCLYLKQNAAAE